MPVTPWPTILPTGQDIYTQALDYADMTNSQFPDTTLALKHVNNALSKLHYHLANRDNDWFAEQAYFQVTANTEFFSLPNGTNYVRTSTDSTIPKKFYRLTHLMLHVGNREYEIPKLNRHEAFGFTRAPLASGYIDMLYVPEFKPLTSLADAIDTTYPVGWEDYCAWVVARRMLMKEESMEAAHAAEGEAAELLREIDMAVTERDSYYPQRIEDTSNRFNWRARWLLPMTYQYNYSYRVEGQNIVIVQPDIVP